MSPKTRILLVDDEPYILDFLSQLLAYNGYEVRTAATGREGLEGARQWRPDLVLLDVQLPDLNGFEVCHQIKSDPALLDVFVILHSGEATSTAHKVGGLDTGADEYLTKPVDGEELLARLRTVARLRDTTAALRASEQHYRRLVEILPDAVATLDHQGRLTAVNPQAVAMLGYAEAGELLGKDAAGLAPPPDQARFREELAGALKTGLLPNPESTLLRKNGEAFPVEIAAAVHSDRQGEPAGLLLAARDISDRKRAEQELRRLPSRIIEAQEAERRRVARELHDGVNQILASAKMRLRKVEDTVTDLAPEAAETLARCGELLVEALEENRRIAHGLRPTDLDQLGLPDACRHLCAEFTARSGLGVDCRIALPVERLPEAVELNVFRIVQEALGNIEQHAQATAVSVQIAVQGGTLELTLVDNGRGFDPAARVALKGKHRGLGLVNIHERVVSIGGACKVEAAPGRGVAISVRVPLGTAAYPNRFGPGE